MKILNFIEPLFHYNVTILIGRIIDIQNYNPYGVKFHSYILASMQDRKECETVIFTDSYSDKQVVIYSVNDIALINRQIFNAVMMTLNKEGIQYNDNNSNVFAALIEFYTNNVFNALHEYLEKDALEVCNKDNIYFLSLKSE